MALLADTLSVTDADVEAYWRRGYWISPRLFDDAQIAALREGIERLRRGEKDSAGWGWSGSTLADPKSPAMWQVVNAWWISDAIRAGTTSATLGYVASRLLKTDRVQLLHDQALVKPPLGDSPDRLAGNFGWHQDFAYWDWVNTTNLTTCWVALQDTDLSIGGMRTIVGSHTWGYNPDSGAAFNRDLDGLREKFANSGREWIDEPCILKAGQASFHHSLTYHGSGPNTTDRPRMSIVAHIMPGSAGYNPGGKYNRMQSLLGPGAKAGDPFPEHFFPTLWPIG